MHGGPNHLDLERNQRIEVVVERIAKRRSEHDGAGWPGLVVVVHDLGKPFQVKLPVHVGGFAHGGHVEIAVVVVADVLLVEPGDVVEAEFALIGDGFAHVPIGDQLHAVGVGVDG